MLCLQECDTTDIPDTISGLRLADSTHRNRLGLAVYYRENIYRVVEVRSMALKKSLHDRVLKPAEERMLGVRLHDIDHGREFIVASFHAAPLTALNSLRRHQIRTALSRAAANSARACRSSWSATTTIRCSKRTSGRRCASTGTS